MRTIPYQLPFRFALLNPLSELRIFHARARQDRDKAPLVFINVLQVVLAAELGIGHIEEVAFSRDLAQGVPGLDVTQRVRGVAVFPAELYRYAAVGGGRQQEDQLL
jgi:hypothetical protein